MKRLSWKICVGILVFGILLWAGTGLFSITEKKAVMYKRYEAPLTGREAAKTDWYAEAKFWAETTGKVASGIGGACIAIKAMFEVFKKKRGEKNA